MPVHVLLVDDEPNLLELTKHFLELDPEINVSTAESAKNALNLLDGGCFDAIVSDYQMPGMDGLELLSCIRSRELSIPFIIFTGRGREEVVIEALNLGADFYLQKGGDPKSQFTELRSKINHAIERRRAEENLKSAYSDLQTAYEKTLAHEKALAEKNRLLEESEGRFKNLANTTSTAIMVFQEDKWIYANRAAEGISGYSVDELKNMDFWEFVAPEYREVVTERGKKRQKGEESPMCYDFRIITKQGEGKWVHLCGSNITVEGKSAGLVTVTDITDLKETEEELRKNEALYQGIFESQLTGQILIDPEDHTIVDINDKAAGMIGRSRDEIIGRICHNFVCPSEENACPVTDLGHTMDESERILLNADGTAIPILKYAKKINIGGRTYLIETFSDITSRKRAEEELRKSEDRFRKLIENLPIGLVQADMEGRINYLNPMILKMFDSPSIDAIRKINLLTSTNLIEIGVSKDIREAMESGKIVDAERRYVSTSGAEVYMMYKIAPLFRDDDVSGVLAIVEDVTPRVQAENALKLANHKFSLLSQITRHDILNDLTAAGGYIELLRMDHPELDGYYFDRILDSMNRIRKEAEFTRDYQELGANPPLWQDLDVVIANSLSKAVLPADADVRIDLPHVEIHADPMLEKAIFNIVKNAFQHAMGMTALTIGSHHSDDDALTIFIEDDGPGIPEKEKDLIFRSSYKRRHGHGLFLVKEILDLTGISIKETGKPGCGACFEINVPPGRWHPSSE